MDSLVANYASSDDEEEQQQTNSFPSKPVSSLFSYLPQPKSSPLFSAVPQQKQLPQKNPITKTPIGNNFDGKEDKDVKKGASTSNKSSSIFSSLPRPKSQTLQQSVSVEKTTKKVVQFKPPAPMQSNNISDEDEDEDDEEKERKKRKQSEHLNQNSSVQSFLSSIPAPKSSATLGVLHSGSGSGRRSIIETEALAPSSSGLGARKEAVSDQNMVNNADNDMGSDHIVNYVNYAPGVDHSVENYTSYGAGGDQSYVNYANYQPGGDQVVQSGDASSYVNYDGYNGSGDYNGFGDYGHYGTSATVQETAVVAESAFRMPGKRGRKEIPMEIVEVEQDELIKNRPREDQVKLTGIAFGPSYQPVSTKGKPTKLHKRKHQISSLYFDMKQKEMELAERRARGFQTKAQTQGKYGW